MTLPPWEGESLFPTITRPGLQDWPADYEQQFWDAYPRRVAKLAAMKALDKTRRLRIVEWRILIDGVRRYAEAKRGTDAQYLKHPATWLNAGCWADEEPMARRSFADIAMGR